jgi:hypothetical protein
MASKPTLTVTIMSRNRPRYLSTCLLSIFDSIKLLPAEISCSVQLSDNSDNDLCLEMAKEINPLIAITPRRPNISFTEHIRIILDECKTTYLVIFHDDDIMFPLYLTELYLLITNNENVAAVGCNANYMCGDIVTNNTFFNIGAKTLFLDSKELLLDKYFLIGNQGIAPLPSYMYRLSQLKQIRPHQNRGGLHSDCSFLFDIVNKSPIIWTSKVLMSYRLHENNVTKDATIYNKLALKRYLSSHYKLSRPQALLDYRYTIMIGLFRGWKLNIFMYGSWSHQQKVVAKFLLSELYKHFLFRPNCRYLHIRVFYNKMSNWFRKNIIENIFFLKS